MAKNFREFYTKLAEREELEEDEWTSSQKLILEIYEIHKWMSYTQGMDIHLNVLKKYIGKTDYFY